MEREPQSLQEKCISWMRTAKKRESPMKHRFHCLQTAHSLRCSVGGWALRLRLWRSGLGLAVWRLPEGLGSSAPELRDQGAQEEVCPHRKSKVPLLRRARRGAEFHQRNILPLWIHWPSNTGSQAAGHLLHRLWAAGANHCSNLRLQRSV